MNSDLEALAVSHGIQTRYRSETGEERVLGEMAMRSLLKAMGVNGDAPEWGESSRLRQVPEVSCIAPEAKRYWGISCQIYALRSARSIGVGDFEDLARLAEIAAHAGAGFLGVSPLHALFFANPGHYSPYSPSTRRFLNPMYIAIDQLPGWEEALRKLRADDPAALDDLDSELIDYTRTGRAKLQVLQTIFDQTNPQGPAYDAFYDAGGDALADFALFEAISAYSVAAGGSAGWHGWPEPLQHSRSAVVATFAQDHANAVQFHCWLQFVADAQLKAAQQRALAAGMPIGLYLDIAVGVSPDGAETWADPEVTVPTARVGSPPDMFNTLGQDWGLAPLSPEALAARQFQPLEQMCNALMRHAGAVRIDHVMGLSRLWWVAEGYFAADGGYVRYPLGDMVDAVARASQTHGCMVIGEDLGTVPDGFREVMADVNILSYRVLYFEKRMWEGFFPPDHYPTASLACISTHDLATLAGWWQGRDVELRFDTGRQDEEATKRDWAERDNDRRALLHALRVEGLLPEALHAPLNDGSGLPEQLPPDLAIAVHRFMARTASCLVAVQLDDLVLEQRQANLPGTTDAYPNWRIRNRVPVDELERNPEFTAIAAAMREERPL
ncbi:4-alpha-glucanotransferase [Aureimonas fodinaquatilis]|uniref:4-alpha-glucanotransferase n=1 Tax=Aureimonas fodinaquatilis TaxID=2565783 RepID=A0A5B0DRE1_9HYPH|nr:4-alpha-glucanotransferase [Aureimonas fodinaquatilis]KAA0968943.1 4-alpha-glucanotransferase [Aureimonas fodinaquatilis]